MSTYSRSHLADSSLLDALATHLAGERASLAEVLADLAEVDARKLYLAAAFPTLHDWCVGTLHMSEHSAYKYARAAQAALRFPVLFEAVADGRLHLSAVVMLKRYLTEETVADLVAAAAHKTKVEIEHLIAERFPRRDLPTSIRPLAAPDALQLAPGPIEVTTADTFCQPGVQVASFVPAASSERATLHELSPQRFGLQVTITGKTHDKLRYAQELMSHKVGPGDIGGVLDLALEALIERLEKGKFGATSRPRRGRGLKSDGRYIPVEVRCAVWKRDGAQCTFVSESGQRCPARDKVEFDHIEPFANGGLATAANLRLRCRAHNQYCAGLKFGAEFMKQKRESVRRAVAQRAERAAAKRGQRVGTAEANRAERSAANDGAYPAAPMRTEEAAAGTHAVAPTLTEDHCAVVAGANSADDLDVIPWLRALGFRADEARQAAEACAHMTDASLEERVRVALSSRARSRPRAA